MSRASKSSARKQPDSTAEIKKWAAIEVLPWTHTSQPGPSRKQWDDWGAQHGSMLRIACGVMMLTKDQLGDLAGGFEGEDKFDEALIPYDASIKFFADMAKTIEAAKTRLLIGSAVNALRLASGETSPRVASKKRRKRATAVGVKV